MHTKARRITATPQMHAWQASFSLGIEANSIIPQDYILGEGSPSLLNTSSRKRVRLPSPRKPRRWEDATRFERPPVGSPRPHR